MITLYRVADCGICDEVQETLRELVVAHEVVEVTRELAQASVGNGATGAPTPPAAVAEHVANGEMPVVMDGERVISGTVALRDYMAELAREMEQWRKFQTDACYIDDKGQSC